MARQIHNKKEFYHGTTDAIPIQKLLLSPETTGIKHEDWRKKYADKVFFTTSVISAEKYARKACEKYGCNPIVYIVKTISEFWNTINTEYISDSCLIIDVWKEKRFCFLYFVGSSPTIPVNVR